MYADSLTLIPDWVLMLAQSMIALALIPSGLRAWLGPDVPDRVVALDLIAAIIIAQAVLLVFRSGFISYLDVGTAIALISFLATVAFARYLERKERN